MIPWLDNGNPDAWPVYLDFSGAAVGRFYGDQSPTRDADWMTRVYWQAWNMIAPIGVLRLTTNPPGTRMGRYVRPGELIRVSVVPRLDWPPASGVAGYTPQPLDRWPHWWQTPECFVAFQGTPPAPPRPEEVGRNVVHELGHVIAPSLDSHWYHNPALGTVFGPTPPPPEKCTVNAPLCRELFGAQLALIGQGWRWDDAGKKYQLPASPPPVTTEVK